MLSRSVVRVSRITPAITRGIFETKNTIAETRTKYYAHATNPTYLKEPGDRIIFSLAIGGLAVGVSTIFYGLYSMSFGINKLQK